MLTDALDTLYKTKAWPAQMEACATVCAELIDRRPSSMTRQTAHALLVDMINGRSAAIALAKREGST